jgi:hypothetical protein
MKSWKLRLRGGSHVPWERDELWAPFISTLLPWRRGGGRASGKQGYGPFPFKDLAQHRHSCGRCLRLGTRDPGIQALLPQTQEYRPQPSSLRLGVQVQSSSLRLLSSGSSYSRPQTPSHKCTGNLKREECASFAPSWGLRTGNIS